ncbi:MAG: tyrosine-protein phosphatase [Sphingomonas sp.]
MPSSRIAAACAAVLILSAPLVARPPAPATAIAATAIPFETARVEGGTVTWSAPGTRRVRLYATTDAAGVTALRPIGAGAGTGALTLPTLPAAARWYVKLVPDRGAPLVVAARDLGFANAPNLRDLGGYRTVDGRWVRTGLIFRSDQMNLLSDAELDRLHALGVTRVADLRTQAERAREPDRVPAGATYLVMDVMAATPGSAGGDMMGEMRRLAAQGQGAQAMIGANRGFVSSPGAATAYAALFRTAAQGTGGALVYHCTAGKDRTGWASAMLLLALGVPRATVMDDYLRSNALLAAKHERQLARMQALSPAALTQARAMFAVRAHYLDAALDEMTTRYGSLDDYLTHGLGIRPAELAALRARYLVGTPVGRR